MADQQNPYPRGIVKFKDILSERFQKPFESISESDIRSDLLTSGRTKADIRDVIQGFRKFKRKDADFTLDEGGFRINTTEGALKGSGRRKGRTVGQSDLARVLRLGEDVSKFAGYAEGVAKVINIPEVVEPAEEEPLVDEDINLGDIDLDIDPNIAGPERKEQNPRTGSGGGGTGGGTGSTDTTIEETPAVEEITAEDVKEKVENRQTRKAPSFLERLGNISDAVNEWLQRFRPNFIEERPYIPRERGSVVDLTQGEIRSTKNTVGVNEVPAIPKPPRKFGEAAEEVERGITIPNFKKGGRFQGTESRIQSEYDNLETPHANIDLDLGRMIWQDQKSDSPLMFDETYYMAQEGPGYTAKSFKTSDDTSELGKMKKGGKMMKGQTGLKLTPFFADSGLYDNINTDLPFLAPGANTGDVYATSDAEQGDLFATDEGTGKKGLSLNDIMYYGATFGLPVGKAIQSTIAMNRVKDKMVPDLVSPDLNVGVVRDIRRPDQAIGYKPTTADIGAENANRQFQRAQNRAQRFAFEAGQDESKIRQEEAIRENQNRQAMMDAEMENREKMIESNLASKRFFTELGQRNQAVIGGAETMANTAVANQYTQSLGRLELAKGMMRAGNIEGAKKLLGILKKGGKLTKFSKRYGIR